MHSVQIVLGESVLFFCYRLYWCSLVFSFVFLGWDFYFCVFIFLLCYVHCFSRVCFVSLSTFDPVLHMSYLISLNTIYIYWYWWIIMTYYYMQLYALKEMSTFIFLISYIIFKTLLKWSSCKKLLKNRIFFVLLC